MEKRILVTVRGEGCEEKASVVAEGIRRMLETNGIMNAEVCLQEELNVFSFVNDSYVRPKGGRRDGE